VGMKDDFPINGIAIDLEIEVLETREGGIRFVPNWMTNAEIRESSATLTHDDAEIGMIMGRRMIEKAYEDRRDLRDRMLEEIATDTKIDEAATKIARIAGVG